MLLNGDLQISVIELGVKPYDLIDNPSADEQGIFVNNRRNYLRELNLNSIDTMRKYLYWYPLIASCSFIRANRNDPFASEYIIPQLLMQWVRTQVIGRKLVGIRYFSCASFRASELGLNYVFPVSGKAERKNPNHCSVLKYAFKLTKPHYIHEYESIEDCEQALISDDVIDYI